MNELYLECPAYNKLEFYGLAVFVITNQMGVNLLYFKLCKLVIDLQTLGHES